MQICTTSAYTLGNSSEYQITFNSVPVGRTGYSYKRSTFRTASAMTSPHTLRNFSKWVPDNEDHFGKKRYHVPQSYTLRISKWLPFHFQNVPLSSTRHVDSTTFWHTLRISKWVPDHCYSTPLNYTDYVDTGYTFWKCIPPICSLNTIGHDTSVHTHASSPK